MYVRRWADRLLLRAPASFRILRDAPVIGELVHRLSYTLVPADAKVWMQVASGAAEGIWLHLNPRTGQNYQSGKGEVATQQALLTRLRPGMTFYDLGANIGFFSLLAARLVGPEGKVFSFEPDTTVATRLRKNAERNRFGNITVHETDVWSSSGMLDFAMADPASPDHGTGRFLPGGGRPQARCISIDDFAQTAPPPDAIKCDVEGAELEVLPGARRILATQKPWVLCETHSPEADRESRAILHELGSTIEAIDAMHFLAEHCVQRDA